MTLLKYCCFLSLLTIMFSCESRKKIVYFNNLELANQDETPSNLQPITIQTGDILQITISTINRDVSALLNPMAPATGIVNQSAPGYLVDHDGNIELPMIGKVYVRDKTTDEINEDIKIALDKTIVNPFVSTRLLNFKISVLGDVARPGSFTIANERISVLEALSLAGDVNFTARRDDVLLIREREGKKRYISLNLNDSKTLSSPYFYLNNNDVIYVKPGNNRILANTTGFQLLPTIFTTVSLLLVLYNTTRR